LVDIIFKFFPSGIGLFGSEVLKVDFGAPLKMLKDSEIGIEENGSFLIGLNYDSGKEMFKEKEIN
jgi:hypothetical protein